MTILAMTSLFPLQRLTQLPIKSVTPVNDKPADKIKTAATMMAGSLENPEKAALASISPVKANDKIMRTATTSTRMASVMNRTTEMSMIIIISKNIIIKK